MSNFEEISEHHEVIEQMYNEGASRVDIARCLEIPVHQLRSYMIMQGWFRDPVLQSREELITVLDATGWVNTRAADFVGCSEATIRDRRRKFNV